jgi:capsular exopolysaccharide synthesis family protein
LAYVADRLDKSFRTPEEIRRRLGWPIFGHIPYLEKAGEPMKVAVPGGREWALDGGLVTVHNPRSTEAEAYRAVRTGLYFSTHEARHQVIQLTSPTMSDGKSTLAANLAVTIAQSGKRVILLDADFRRPNVHKLFGVSARKGLASVMVGDLDIDAALQPTPVPGLWVVPCGPRPFNPAELLTSPRFAELLDELRQRADFVIVDTPPLLAVTDPCAVAARVDGVLLTIRLSKNSRPPAERAKEILASVKAKVFGVVVNTCDRREVPKGYGQEQLGYGQGYEYTDDDLDQAERSEPTKGELPHRVSSPVAYEPNGQGTR